MLATALAAAVLTMTAPPADPTPVPPEETGLARTAFVDTVADSTVETLEFVACESHHGMSEPTSEYGEQPTVVTNCYGSLPGEVIWGVITHVTDDLNLIWTRYSAEGMPNLVPAIPAPPLADRTAPPPPGAGVPTTVVDEAAETLPPEDTLPQDSVVAGAAETLPPEDTVPPPPTEATVPPELMPPEATSG